MELTNDLIRNTLMCIEKKCVCFTDNRNRFNYKLNLHWIEIYEDEDLISKYTVDAIKYCISKLYEESLISARIPGKQDSISMLIINGITYKGHMFLNSIKDESIWTAIKNKIGTSAKVSIHIISEVITEVGTTFLKEKLGLI